MQLVGYCPVCGDEFRPEIATCSDCGGPLIVQEEGLGSQDVRPRPDGEEAWRTVLDTVSIAALIPLGAFGALDELEPAVGALAEIHMPSRVLVQNGRYLLLVRPSDLARSKEAVEVTVGGMGVPEHAAAEPPIGTYSQCPACDAALPEDFDGSCPECGLELGGTPSPIDVSDPQ